jgi:hypothetical protein
MEHGFSIKEYLEAILALFGTLKLTHEVYELLHHLVKVVSKLFKYHILTRSK